MSAKVLSIAAYVVMAAAVVALFYTRSLIGTGPVTITIQIVAVLVMLWARFTFGRRSFHAAANTTEGGLVTSGPYHWLRHPIYASILWFVWTGVAAHPTLLAAALALLVTACAAVRIAAEESFLRARYPDYADYARRTPRVLPFLF